MHRLQRVASGRYVKALARVCVCRDLRWQLLRRRRWQWSHAHRGRKGKNSEQPETNPTTMLPREKLRDHIDTKETKFNQNKRLELKGNQTKKVLPEDYTAGSVGYGNMCCAYATSNRCSGRTRRVRVRRHIVKCAHLNSVKRSIENNPESNVQL
jgi:hypothetical protein